MTNLEAGEVGKWNDINGTWRWRYKGTPLQYRFNVIVENSETKQEFEFTTEHFALLARNRDVLAYFLHWGDMLINPD